MKNKFLIAIILTGFSAILFGVKTFAQTPTPSNYDVTVSPVYLDLSANPGEKINTKIRIRNNTNSPLPIKLEVKKMAGDQVGNLTLQDTSNDNSLSWITFESDKLIANPLEWTDIPLTIDVPKEAAYGYYFAISLTQDGSSPIKTTGTSITGAAAIPVLLNVIKEGAKAQAKLLDFSTENYINEYLPVNFKVYLENTGNIHIVPKGNVFISSGSNKNLAVMDINSGAGNLIPETKRTFQASWEDGFFVKVPVLENKQPKLDRSGKQVYTLQINWNKLTSFRMGKYTANLILVFDNGTRDVAIEKTINFWVIPYKALAVIFITIVILTLVIRFLLKYYINREVRKRLKD